MRGFILVATNARVTAEVGLPRKISGVVPYQVPQWPFRNGIFVRIFDTANFQGDPMRKEGLVILKGAKQGAGPTRIVTPPGEENGAGKKAPAERYGGHHVFHFE